MIEITEEVIENLKCVKVFDTGDKEEDERLNKELLELHQYTLQCARDLNDDKEYAFLWDLNTDKWYGIPGGERNVNIKLNSEASKLLNNSDMYVLVLTHNHPSNSIFSATDVKSFLLADSLQVISAIGNGGRCSILRKLKNFDNSIRRFFISSYIAKEDTDYGVYIKGDIYIEYSETLVSTVLNNLEVLGLKYYTGK